MDEKISLLDSISEAILALPEVKTPELLANAWLEANQDKDFLDLITQGFPDDLIVDLHAAVSSNDRAIRNANKRIIEDLIRALPSLPVVQEKGRRRLVV